MRDVESVGVYIHIPFCVRKCLYCDFLSFPAGEELMAEYLEALCAEIRSVEHTYKAESIYFGGGTPSLPGEDYIPRIMDTLRASFDIAKDAEITMEVNPGTMGIPASSGETAGIRPGSGGSDISDKLGAYVGAGINRLSIGLQSANNDELRMLGRIHTFEDFLETYRAARNAGFRNINVDLMRGIPNPEGSNVNVHEHGQTGQEENCTGAPVTASSRRLFEHSLDSLLSLEPDPPEHISVYSLIIEEGTPFHDMYAGGCGLPDEDEEMLMSEDTERLLAKGGYRRYEISNYAKEGFECVHNIRYWRRGDYIGFGLGAASLTGNGTVRYHNTRDINRYLKTGTDHREDMEQLSEINRMEEFMFLGLRMTCGILTEDFRREFGRDIMDIYGDVISRYSQTGLLIHDHGRIYLTPRGLDVSNHIMADFIF